MPIIVGIDGTGGGTLPGASRDARYDVDFANSFVKRICSGKPNAQYNRGPVTLGGGLPEAIESGYNFIVSKRRIMPNEPVLLTGYSRGGLGVIVIAKRLKDANIPVRALLLFDAVDRHLAYDGSVIPNNVGFVCHVIRDPNSSSRESFGNDGMSYSAPTVFPAAYKFMCTHGGMGGTPWKPTSGQKVTDYVDEGGIDGMTKITFAQDAAVSAQVWQFVQPFMRTHGFI